MSDNPNTDPPTNADTVTESPQNISITGDADTVDGKHAADLGGHGSATYMYSCDDSTNMERYDISANSWTYMTDAPSSTTGAIVNGHDGFLYRHDNSTNFYSYDVSADSWTTLADTATSYGNGWGAMTFD